MRLSLDALETLDAIDEAGSFARAAERLHRVPSAITYTVNKLESDLGLLLFDRSGKRAQLTAAGRELLNQGRELLRSAEQLESRVKRIAQGWEPQLTIALDAILPIEQFFPLISEFDALVCGTRLRFLHELLDGTWDALIDRRADLAVAAPGEPPAGYGLSSVALGRVPFVYALAPFHPLASAPEPLSDRLIARYRAIVAADSSRRLPGRTLGLQPNQDTLIVPSLGAKLAAQIQGLGVGFLPACVISPAVASGQLVIREVESPRDDSVVKLGWRTGDEGRAAVWFRERIIDAASQGRLLPNEL